ncbi:MAG: site-specific DNA-methyltransferase [Bacteroidetes bacterium HGW-Bacteroidetes-8]|jgi:adenine-specific DNA-methyltransferase|nr:MAG: site-specific DNA-methyltransferase [Bacteroidetes bacterium HGW-Bacteroidetes-8]
MEKITLDHPDSQSADLVAQHIEQLSQLFPEVINEGKVDFEALQDLLGNYTDTPEERFQLNWAGKAQARCEAQKRSTGTLRPCPEESVDWNTTENLYIEGDNLEVLKLLQKSYYKKVKMIYIDPPYNTGKDFVYKDNYIDNMTNYLEISGQDRSLGTNTESDGRYHSNWLNMMYPRLKLARNLLTDDGVIFISIDENEFANLKKVCNEIFGEENFIASIANINNPKGRSDDKYIATAHEYISLYAKEINSFQMGGFVPTDEIIKRYNKVDTNGKKFREIDLRKTGENDLREDRPNLFYYFVYNEQSGDFYPSKEDITDNCIIIKPQREDQKEGNWRWGFETSEKEIHNLFPKYMPNRKVWGVFEKDYLEGRGAVKPTSAWTFKDVNSERGTEQFIDLGFEKTVFAKPKPIGTVIRASILSTKISDIILDFFSGSATTAHAVMQLNSEDGGNRKFIMVQLPEATPEDSEARKAGYKTIAEIGKERIRRAGNKIIEELKAKKAKEGALFTEEHKILDIGFKVFKLDSSNINTWDSSPSNLEGALYNSVQNIKSDRTEHDLLYEILLKYGIDLVQPINEHTLVGKKVYEMGAGALIVCMADNIKPETAEAIAQLWKKVKPTAIDESSKAAINCRVVFKDNGFDDNNDKTNIFQILKQHGIDNVVTI